MSEDRGHRVFRFGPFEASETAGELRKHGTRIKLHSQPFQVLMLLLEKPAEIVTREEMRQQLWSDGTFVDFDHGLNTAVNKIREALGDSALKPRFIETVSGKGYRFIAPVTLRAPVLAAEKPAAVVPETATIGFNPPLAAAQTVTASGAAEAPATVAQTATLAQTADASQKSQILTAPGELPTASRKVVRTLLLLVQAMYLAFYVGALANLLEIHDIFLEADLPATTLIAVVVTASAVLIPIRLYLATAVVLDFRELQSKFGRMFPVLLVLDLLWAVSPFLLIHHVSAGLALGMSAPLVYVPFAQRSLVLMYSQRGSV